MGSYGRPLAVSLTSFWPHGALEDSVGHVPATDSGMKKIFITILTLAGLAFTASAAEVVVRIGPPRAVVERRSTSPGRGYVWMQGYQNWDGRSHVWVPGRWETPPRGQKHWQGHRWVKRHNEWVLVEGRWR
jgi:hypothetical protein